MVVKLLFRKIVDHSIHRNESSLCETNGSMVVYDTEITTINLVSFNKCFIAVEYICVLSHLIYAHMNDTCRQIK